MGTKKSLTGTKKYKAFQKDTETCLRKTATGAPKALRMAKEIA